MASGRLIEYLGEGLLSARPSTPDVAPGALALYYANDTSQLFGWDSVAGVWDEMTGGGGAPITVVTGEPGTTLLATPANAWNYTRFVNVGTKTYTFDSAETYVTNAEYYGRNVGAGDLTLVEAGTFSINLPAGGSLVIPQGGTFSLKMTSASSADLILYGGAGTGPPVGSPPVYKAGGRGSGSGTSLIPPMPAGIAAGDLHVMSITVNSTTGTSLSAPGWTILASSDNPYRWLIYRISTGSDPDIVITNTVSRSYIRTWALIEAGTFDPANPIASTDVLGSNAYNILVNPPTNTWNNSQVLWFAMVTSTSSTPDFYNVAYAPFSNIVSFEDGGALLAYGVFDYTLISPVRLGGSSTTGTMLTSFIGVNPAP